MKANKVLVMSIKPKYANMIYDGSKMFEFRKVPPRNLKAVYVIYESAPVSGLTGAVTFSASFTCRSGAMVSTLMRIFNQNKAGIIMLMGVTEKELISYAGGENEYVTALLVNLHERNSYYSKFTIRPPQNWGSIKFPGYELIEKTKRLLK